jgi:hypothetical protein
MISKLFGQYLAYWGDYGGLYHCPEIKGGKPTSPEVDYEEGACEERIAKA